MKRGLVAVLLATACGSTVPTSSSGTGPGGDSLGLATPGQVLTRDGATSTGGSAAGSSTGRPDPAVAVPAGRGDAGNASDTPPGGAAPGPLTIGTYYFDASSTNSLISSVGANSAVGDMRAEQNAVAAYINSHGGAGGRQLTLAQHRVDVQGNPNTEAQKLCAAWTEDAKAYAGLGSLPTTNPTLVSCLANKKTLAIGGSSSNVETSTDFARWAPYYYAPAAVELVTAGRIYAEGLLSKGFLTKQSKVGIVYVEDAIHEAAYQKGLLPALSRAGIDDPLSVGVSYDGSYAQYAGLVSQAQSAAFQFRSRGVTHVLFVDTGGALAFWFMQQAQSQSWKPRYGLSTLSAPSFLETNIEPSQLNGSAIVGWRPADDLTDVSRFPVNPARQLCSSIMKRAGLTPVSPFDLQIQLTTCSGFFLLKTALDRAASLRARDVHAAVSALGSTNVPSASGFLDHYAAGKAWGGSGYATGRFVTACACFQYDRERRTL